jgi:hypothetical protein
MCTKISLPPLTSGLQLLGLDRELIAQLRCVLAANKFKHQVAGFLDGIIGVAVILTPVGVHKPSKKHPDFGGPSFRFSSTYSPHFFDQLVRRLVVRLC